MRGGTVKAKILFDKYAGGRPYLTGWGVSFLVDERLLFDTGENGDWLLRNMETMKIDIDRIESVVISHDHWDHTGGLWRLLETKPSIIVHGLAGFGDEFKRKVLSHGSRLIEASEMTEVSKNIYTSGEIIGTYKELPISEQALVVTAENAISIITGCAHPGVSKMVRIIMRYFPDKKVSLVMGGFHLMRQGEDEINRVVGEFRALGVEKAGPTHCSGDEAERAFKEAYGENFVPVVVGDSIAIA